MPTRLARAAVVAMAFTAMAPGATSRTASAATGAVMLSAVVAPIEQETLRNILQHLLQSVRDQIRRKIIGEPPKPEPGK